MDIALSEEQEMLWKLARNFLADKCPKTLVREMEEDEKGYSPEVWNEMAELGWMGLVFPEEYGGSGGSFMDLVILLEEMGRACLPGPFLSTVVLGGLPLLELGTAEQKKSILPKICKGEAIATLALTEPSAKFDASGVQASAKPDGNDYIINGTKLFVPDAHIADWIICVARTGEGSSPEDQVALFLVDGKSSGLSTTVLKTIAGDKQCELVLNNVKVPKENMLGRGWDLVAKIQERAAIAKCAEMAGGARCVLEFSTEYAKERVAFDHPIGSYQSIQHHLVDMLIDVDTIRYAVYRAAWMCSEGLPCSREIAAAKAWSGEAYRRITFRAHMVHGAVGFTTDHDCELYYRRAKGAEYYFGDGDYYREVMAQKLGV
ncbi:acyl-CoA dehydrogenase family protein [Chloroflexota bacterium]